LDLVSGNLPETWEGDKIKGNKNFNWFLRLEDFKGCWRMIKKLLVFFFLIFVMAGLAKALFFSGTARSPRHANAFRKSYQKQSVLVAAGGHYERSWLGELFLGKHWREVWTTPIEAPVLDFSQTFGGLKPGKMGGGMQTTSLNVSSADGRTFVLRSLDKDPVGILPPFWRHSLVADLVRDQVSAANPYAALVVAPLSESAGLLHTNPRLVFIAAQDPHIQTHRQRMADRLFLLEEKYTAKSLATFESAVGIYNSVEMLDQRFRYPNHFIDQQSFLRCRLFDIFLGDWDRHEGQWNWAAYPAGQEVWYKPIPKDRDQAFSRYQDGLLPWLLTRDFALPKFGHFNGKLENVTPFTINGRFLDERALNTLHRKDFLKAARALQTALTDEVIDQAVKQYPPPIYKLIGKDTARQLKQRREHLQGAAKAYYQHLAKNVVVAGSDDKDKFVVKRLNDRQTLVQVYQVSPQDSVGKKSYQRFFNREETESITLHGLAGDDEFALSGEVAQGIIIKVIGGLGSDVIRDQSLVHQGDKKTLVFDTRQGNLIVRGSETADHTTKDISVHNYDREGY
jgi:hypothetical protein